MVAAAVGLPFIKAEVSSLLALPSSVVTDRIGIPLRVDCDGSSLTVSAVFGGALVLCCVVFERGKGVVRRGYYASTHAYKDAPKRRYIVV